MTQVADQYIEKEIQDKGLTAPRVTQHHIESVIASEHYFTAGDGIAGVCYRQVKTLHSPQELELLTLCVLVLKNGFTVTGESACASPENFDSEIRRKIARQNAVNKIWQLEGYLLKQRLYEQSLSEPLPDDVESTTLPRDQCVKINGIPFSLLEEVKAITGKGGTALAFENLPGVGVGNSEAEDTGYNIDLIARISHEVNRAYCAALGDGSQMSWDDAPDWQKDSARLGAEFHLNGEHGPEASHNSWLAQKQAEGWVYGPVKDAEKKEHPCFVPYDQLPKEQQVKDYLFRAVVHAFK
ncbi:hypothetical protein IM881_06190 [Pectobacterium brasiliense]|nr:hypothetical protein [Pectobacterium brasiliense]